MTLLSRRKRRTTVRPTTPGTAAAKAALLLALFAAPALAQPPGTPPPGLPGGNLQPGAQGQPGAQAQPGTQAQPNGLALPPGYRPRTPPPQPQAQTPPQRSMTGAMPGSGGTVMYFQKPADALTATGGGLPVGAADGVAQLGAAPAAVPLPVPDVLPAPVRPAPVPVPSERAVAQPYLQPPAVNVPVVSGYAAQPAPQPQPGDVPSTSEKKKQDFKPPPVDPKLVQLPSRGKIFDVMYDDAELERAIMESIRREQEQYSPNVKIPLESLKFPPLPVVSPPGLAYQPKTPTYAPRTLYVEPGYVVHRRLHFEERNAERAGWDLGPLSTLVTAAHFYRDVLLWPGSLVTGCSSGFWDTSAGKCLPGSPSPYYLYPPGLSTAGWLAEAGIITGVSFLFP